ncbi:MAG: hypothetical protein WDM81_19555 [Rhizomicrobium sp.]
MFANILPDLARRVGDTGLLQIAVDPRLVPLFQRSFPNAEVGTYDDRTLVDPDGDKPAALREIHHRQAGAGLLAADGLGAAISAQGDRGFPARGVHPARPGPGGEIPRRADGEGGRVPISASAGGR